MTNLILLLVLGGVFYYIMNSYNKYTEYSKEAFKKMSINRESLERNELGLFVALVAKVAKADGVVDTLEAQLIGNMFDDISSIFPQPQKTKDILKDIFYDEKERTDNTEDIAYTLGQITKREISKQQQFMAFLIQLAFVDGEVNKKEDEVLQTIASAMNFDPNLYHKIFDQFEQMMKNRNPQNSLDDAYRLLGVDKNDDMSVIKKAYRKLIRQYHPDIIKSQNQSEAYMKEATKKTQEINQAYEMIKNAKK